MNHTIIVRGAPQEYICQTGCWDDLPQHINKRRIKKLLILHGSKSWEVAKPFLPRLDNVETTYQHYQNECSYEKAEYFSKYIKENEIDGILAVGGGKLLDLGKLVANKSFIDIICLPTLASTCAAYTPLSVVYDKEGVMEGLEFFSKAISLTLVDPKVLIDSPKSYLVAGIGDTLAKWYEADAIISQLKKLPVEVSVAYYAAKQCRDNLIDYGEEAMKDHEAKKVTAAFIKVVETNILLAGMVGGFGDEYGRTSGAHTFHDAMTYLPETKKYLHGNKVAYGILCQLAIEEKWDEIECLKQYYQTLGLPVSMTELAMTSDDIKILAEKASHEDEYIHLLKQTITKEIIIEAIETLEK